MQWLRAFGTSLLRQCFAALGAFGLSGRNEQPTQNWSGQGESDCLIKTKHCDGV